jgi:hypothetical protein
MHQLDETQATEWSALVAPAAANNAVDREAVELLVAGRPNEQLQTRRRTTPPATVVSRTTVIV